MPNVPSVSSGYGDSVDEAAARPPVFDVAHSVAKNGQHDGNHDDEGVAADAGDENDKEANDEEDEEEIVLREKQTVETPEDYTNGDSSDLTESNSLEEDLQKAISTAERRKVFEANIHKANILLNALLTISKLSKLSHYFTRTRVQLSDDDNNKKVRFGY